VFFAQCRVGATFPTRSGPLLSGPVSAQMHLCPRLSAPVRSGMQPVSASQAECRGFEPHHPLHITLGYGVGYGSGRSGEDLAGGGSANLAPGMRGQSGCPGTS